MAEEESRDWLRRGSTDSTEIMGVYDDWADEYDAQLSAWNYRAPEEAAGMLGAHLEPGARFIDIGCGTGLTGVALRKAGFTGPIDGTDLSPKSIELAERRGVYRRAFVADMQQLPLDAEKDAYDGLICCGVLTYLPNIDAVFDEFCRIVRPGGVAVFTHRDDLFESQDFRGRIRALEEAGKWTALAISDPQPYMPENPDFAEKIKLVFVTVRIEA
ncbi:class I SAM-dependent DNA methyltransferase [Pararhizobium mangrovi]|uniref:Methyltransferase domain-containing protein n=1 Tax=Pararhizobium mangrovi TaxID=2590452 RepID=A0A506U2L7_9HYPH|nr:class I SAM-dependent methyltransferase [Pararhizobium mangrovi]TPW26819.1 methyltransferase domain-containing protein [Pararhizobium mangrovi]